MALLAGRRASAYHQPADDRELWDYFRSIGARYVVAVERDDAMGAGRAGRPARIPPGLRRAESPAAFEEVFHNDDFGVYRIRGQGLEIRDWKLGSPTPTS